MKKIPFELQERINSPTEINEILKASVNEKTLSETARAKGFTTCRAPLILKQQVFTVIRTDGRTHTSKCNVCRTATGARRN